MEYPHIPTPIQAQTTLNQLAEWMDKWKKMTKDKKSTHGTVRDLRRRVVCFVPNDNSTCTSLTLTLIKSENCSLLVQRIRKYLYIDSGMYEVGPLISTCEYYVLYCKSGSIGVIMCNVQRYFYGSWEIKIQKPRSHN